MYKLCQFAWSTEAGKGSVDPLPDRCSDDPLENILDPARGKAWRLDEPECPVYHRVLRRCCGVLLLPLYFLCLLLLGQRLELLMYSRADWSELQCQ